MRIFRFHIPDIPHIPEIFDLGIPDIPHFPEIFDLGKFDLGIPDIPHIPEIFDLGKFDLGIPDIPHIPEIFDLGIFCTFFPGGVFCTFCANPPISYTTFGHRKQGYRILNLRLCKTGRSLFENTRPKVILTNYYRINLQYTIAVKARNEI